MAIDSSEDYDYEELGMSMKEELKTIRESGTPLPKSHYTFEGIPPLFEKLFL